MRRVPQGADSFDEHEVGLNKTLPSWKTEKKKATQLAVPVLSVNICLELC